MSPTFPPQLEAETATSAESTATSSSSSANSRVASLPSLPESHRSIPISHTASWIRKVLAFAGPGYLVAVGYMDPGNWATDIGGGSKFGYTLLSVILISNLMAMFLQALSAKLGIATGRDLAQACRERYSRRTSIALWIVCEIAIAACDLAEVLGSAVALKLLFGLPLLAGVIITGLDVLIVLALQGRGFRIIEAFVVTLIAPSLAVLLTKSFSRIPSGARPSSASSHARKFCTTAKCCTSPSEFSALRSCRTISIFIPALCRRAPSAAPFATAEKPCAMPFSIPR